LIRSRIPLQLALVEYLQKLLHQLNHHFNYNHYGEE
jgi:hypothetical protein